MENIIDRRLREWKAAAARDLLEIERYAASIRSDLEDNAQSLPSQQDRISHLHSQVMSLITKADMSEALADARFHQAIQ